MERKYQITGVSKAIYCSSMCNMSADLWVNIRAGNVWLNASYDFNCVDPANYISKRGNRIALPLYIRQEAERQLVAMFDAGELRVYECDRDGNRRFEGLRYYQDWMMAKHIDFIRIYKEESE